MSDTTPGDGADSEATGHGTPGGGGPSEPELVSVEHLPTAVVRGTVPTAELQGFYDSSFRTLAEALERQQAGAVGPAFGLYYGPPGETADLEAGFVTERPIAPDGDVVAGWLPSGRVARLVHHGAFDGLGASWQRLAAWIAEQGLTPGALMWEFYVTEPSPGMDPRDLRTELNWPVTG